MDGRLRLLRSYRGPFAQSLALNVVILGFKVGTKLAPPEPQSGVALLTFESPVTPVFRPIEQPGAAVFQTNAAGSQGAAVFPAQPRVDSSGDGIAVFSPATVTTDYNVDPGDAASSSLPQSDGPAQIQAQEQPEGQNRWEKIGNAALFGLQLWMSIRCAEPRNKV